MSDQAYDNLLNDHPRVCLDELYLYGAFRGTDPTDYRQRERYKYEREPSRYKTMARATNLNRGYIPTFRLDVEGRLWLVGFYFPLAATSLNHQTVREHLTGDFWIKMARSFRSPGIFIPFRDGLIVEDRGSRVLEEISSWGFLRDGSRVEPPWTKYQ
jgi:hypothetical protein